MTDYSSYENYINPQNLSDSELMIARQKEEFERKAIRNPSYTKQEAFRNGVAQRFLIMRSEAYDKATLVTFPNETVCIGDIITFNGLHWLVFEVREVCAWQKTALLWLCNLNLKFQNKSSIIYERWCVFDSGVFSTTLTGDKQVQTGDKQFNMWITLDDQTKKIYVDKRLAVGKKYDKDGNEILDVYAVTAIDNVSKNFGYDSHIIKLSLRDASNYNSDTDNLEDMLCDVVTEVETGETGVKRTSIIGRNSVRIGSNVTYTAVFYDGESEISGITPVWTLLPNIPKSISETQITLDIPERDELIGTTITLSVSDENDEYIPAALSIEVI